MPLLEFRFADHVPAAAPGATLGLLVASGIDLQRLGETLKPAKKEIQRTLAAPEPAVMENLEAFERYFETQQQRSPLLQQRAHFQKAGIPSSNPVVTLLLLAELKHGMLAGIQDAGEIAPPLVFDVLAQEEEFEGMRGSIRCAPGEIVLRDARGIIASLLQGPDKRTQTHAGARELAAFVFSAPGCAPRAVEETLGFLASLLAPVSDTVASEMHTAGG